MTDKRDRRKYISIYFEDGLLAGRKKRDITIAFDNDDPLYRICKKLGSSKIKDLIGIESYRELMDKAQKDERSLSNYIKYLLKQKMK